MNLIGQILQERYYIISAIGEGGMGRVYYAEDKRLNQKVAIKETITKSNESSQEIDARIKSFQREAHLLAGKIKHPAVPKVTDYFQFGENWYIVMEYIDGDNLEKQRKERNQPFSVKEVLLLTDQLLQILDLLHNQDPPIIHRDIKPSNIKVKNDRVYLLDFGLAKQITGSSSTFATFMTPAFASPEQINNENVTKKSDLYSVGATIYFLLTNNEPASAFERSLAIVRGSEDPLQNIKKLRADLPDEMANLIMSALSIKIEERPYSAKIMRLKINDFLTEKDKTLFLLSNISSEKSALDLDKADLKQPESNDSGSKEKSKIPLQSSEQFLTNQSLPGANLIQFESEDFGLKEKTDIPSTPSNQLSASQSPVKSNFNSNDVAPPQTIKQSNRNWLKFVFVLGLFIVIGATGFGVYRNKEKISALVFSTPTPAPTPEPTPNPRDVAIQLTDEAIEELFNNNFDEAERKAKLAVETDKTFAFAHAVYGNCIEHKSWASLDTGDTQKDFTNTDENNSQVIQSRQAVKNLIKEPSTVEEYAALAWSYRNSDEKKSIENAEKAIQGRETFAWASLQQALATQNKKESILLWQKIVELKRNYVFSYLVIASTYNAQGESDKKIIEFYDKAIEAWKDSSMPHYWKGIFLGSKKKYKEGLKEYKLGVEKKPKDINLWLEIADSHRVLKEYSLCVDAVNDAISKLELDDKNLARFYSSRAVCNAGRIKNDATADNTALSDINEAIKRDDKASNYYYKKASILNDFGIFYYNKNDRKKANERFKEAKGILTKALEISPDNSSYKDLEKMLNNNIKISS